jgi:hypothetical protein
MQIGKILSTNISSSRSGIEILTCVVEIRRGQNVTAEWVNNLGESTTPAIGDWVIAVERSQSFGGYFAFGFADVINQIFVDRGVKLIFGRDSAGIVKTTITLTDADIIIENPAGAQISLSDDEIQLNEGSGTAVEKNRLQDALDAFSTVIQSEFVKVAAGTEPNPAAPYVPSPDLPVDISPAESKTIKIP